MTPVLMTELCLVFRGSDLLIVLEETWEKGKEVCESLPLTFNCNGFSVLLFFTAEADQLYSFTL